MEAAGGGSGGISWGGSGGSGAVGDGGGGSAGTAGTSGAGGGSCPPVSKPASVPQGWEPFTGYSCDCVVWIPGTAGAPPEPVEWEACPSPWSGSAVCKRMLTSWSPSDIAVTIFPRFWFDAQAGKAFLQFGRIYVDGDKDTAFRIVADADGPVLNSFFQPKAASEGCAVADASLGGDRFVFSVMGEGGPGPIAPVEGVIGGKIGETVPSVVLKQSTSPTLFANWSATSQWLIESKAGVRARPWNLSELVTVYEPGQDPEKLPSHSPFGVGSAIFTEVGSGSFWGVMSWDPANGLRPLLRAFGDGTQGFGNFMTDGVDMVWTHGTGKSAPGGTPTYPSYDIWTAPFTTDPDAVKSSAKRLRSDLYGIVPTPFGVGCGYAARTVWTSEDGGTGAWNLLVVRLSDGTSWLTDAPNFSTGMGFTAVLGLTCDEVFATAQFPDDKSTIVRVRLDSLGPGMPPD